MLGELFARTKRIELLLFWSNYVFSQNISFSLFSLIFARFFVKVFLRIHALTQFSGRSILLNNDKASSNENERSPQALLLPHVVCSESGRVSN